MSQYKVVNPFPDHTSKGTWDDIYSTEKYDTITEAYKANDYVKGDYVRDEDNVLYIRLKHTLAENPVYYQLQIQKCFAGIDMFDDETACHLAARML